MAAIFFGFGQPARARERQALEVFDEATEFYAQLQQQGGIDSFEVVLLEPHGGDLTGFFLIRGSDEQLAALRKHETFQRLRHRAQLVADHIGVVAAHVGDSLGTELEGYRAQVEAQLSS